MNLHRIVRHAALVALLFSSTQLFGVTLADLRNNPLWLPTTTKLKREVKLGSGRTFPAGTVVKVDAIDGNEVIVGSSDGKSRFKMEMAGITLLDDAKKFVATLKPAQRNLTPNSIRNNQSLWPYTITITNQVNFGDGTYLPVGTTAIVEGFDGNELTIVSHELRGKFFVPVTDTNFYAACLDAAINPPAPRLFQEVNSYAIDAQSRQPADLTKDGGPDYLAFYFAANWCPYSAQTSPSVTELFNKLADEGDERIKFVLISNDKSSAEFRTHLNKLAVKGYAVAPDRLGYLSLLRDVYPVKALPTLYVVDRSGRVVIAKDLPNTVEATSQVLDAIKTL